MSAAPLARLIKLFLTDRSMDAISSLLPEKSRTPTPLFTRFGPLFNCRTPAVGLVRQRMLDTVYHTGYANLAPPEGQNEKNKKKFEPPLIRTLQCLFSFFIDTSTRFHSVHHSKA